MLTTAHATLGTIGNQITQHIPHNHHRNCESGWNKCNDL